MILGRWIMNDRMAFVESLLDFGAEVLHSMALSISLHEGHIQ
jgi:hypothetical protein